MRGSRARNDGCSLNQTAAYEANMVNLIKDVRAAWKKPTLPVTIAASGFDGFYVRVGCLALCCLGRCVPRHLCTTAGRASLHRPESQLHPPEPAHSLLRGARKSEAS